MKLKYKKNGTVTIKELTLSDINILYSLCLYSAETAKFVDMIDTAVIKQNLPIRELDVTAEQQLAHSESTVHLDCPVIHIWND